MSGANIIRCFRRPARSIRRGEHTIITWRRPTLLLQALWWTTPPCGLALKERWSEGRNRGIDRRRRDCRSDHPRYADQRVCPHDRRRDRDSIVVQTPCAVACRRENRPSGPADRPAAV